MTEYQVTFRYEPTPPDLEHLAPSQNYGQRRYCVYECLDAQGRHLYIGRTRNIRERFLSHEKKSPWYSSLAHLIVNPVASFDVSCKLEQRMIVKLRPLYNITKSDAGRRSWETRRGTRPAAHIERGTRMSADPWLAKGDVMEIALRPYRPIEDPL